MEEKRTEAAIRAAVEAILFAAGGSVETARLASALELDSGEMRDCLLYTSQICGTPCALRGSERQRVTKAERAAEKDSFLHLWPIRHDVKETFSAALISCFHRE